jgi:hypothetical protein
MGPSVVGQYFNRYEWVTTGETNCLGCWYFKGQIKPLHNWRRATMPGFHPHCDCYLKPVDDLARGFFELAFPEIAAVHKPFFIGLDAFICGWLRGLVPKVKQMDPYKPDKGKPTLKSLIDDPRDTYDENKKKRLTLLF